MEGCLKNGEVLSKIISAISDLVTDANFDCREQGISLQAMDSSHVSLVSMLLRAEGFEPWRCDDSCQLGIHLEHLMKLLKCMHAKDSVELNYKENGEDLDFIFKSPNEERVSHFSLKLMEIDTEHLGIPETDYQTCVTMPSSEFMRVCRDLASFGDTLTIHVTKDEISFAVAGDMGNGTMSIRNSTATDEEQPDATVIDSKDEISQAFALRYLQHFTKATPLSKVVTLRMTADVPLLVEYQIDELGYLRYYLAPKIDEE
jgi:proliferating cell nuclear antigen